MGFQIINGVKVEDGLLLLEPRKYLDKAVCNVHKGRVIYDYNLLIEAYQELGFDYDESLEWISYNSDKDGIFYGGTKKLLAPQIQKKEEEE